jgi:hypothetical protein
LENYLICPDELWEALPENQQEKIPGGLSELKNQILNDKNHWIRHGVLWSIINPLWDGIVELGFKNALLDFNNAQDDQKIKVILKQWHHFFEPETILNLFQERLRDVMAKDETEQLKCWIHGKKFYREHVHQTLNQFLGQEDAEERKRKILKNCPLPNDLDFVYQRMGLIEL